MKKLTALLFIFFSVNSFAQSSITSGVYVTEGHWGTLEIKNKTAKEFEFNISTIRPNSNLCDVSGKAINGVARLKNEDSKNGCVIKFKNKGDSIIVESNGESCSYYCGANAFFDAEYLKPSVQCSDDAVDKSRNKFTKLYKEKKYTEALAVLEPVLKNCEKTLYQTINYWIRNDLAVTYAKLERFDDCSKILEPLKEDAQMTEEELQNNYPWLYVESNRTVIKATRTNLKLCKIK
jgi:hypothetical protein